MDTFIVELFSKSTINIVSLPNSIFFYLVAYRVMVLPNDYIRNRQALHYYLPVTSAQII